MVVLWDLMAGWWWLEHEWIMTFHIYIGNFIIPTDFHSMIFQRAGWLKTTKQQLWCWPQLHPKNKHHMDLSWCFFAGVLDMTMGPWWTPSFFKAINGWPKIKCLSKLRSLRIRLKKKTGFPMKRHIRYGYPWTILECPNLRNSMKLSTC